MRSRRDRRTGGPSHNDVRGAVPRLSSEEFRGELEARVRSLLAQDDALVLEQLGRWVGRWLARGPFKE